MIEDKFTKNFLKTDENYDNNQFPYMKAIFSIYAVVGWTVFKNLRLNFNRTSITGWEN
jgi:hypothetical protein